MSFTGWKIGWCSGPAELVAATCTAKQFLTFAGETPRQHPAAAAATLERFAFCKRPEVIEAARRLSGLN